MANGSKAVIPWGGQIPPISTAGDKLEWKNAQNTLKKANTSLIINKIKPNIKPFCTSIVWHPKNVPSIIISLNHKIIPPIVSAKPNVKINPPFG
uniref:Uncharacterized protein n=1 Tax=Phlebia radiata TaxID=5308 RepID=L8B9G3_PHLRA|nr:hypothetical protein Pra_mt0310 [Phlebia radiata]CCF07378.1 hypothetical protein Pra_mt0310 [Phlebia radiata]